MSVSSRYDFTCFGRNDEINMSKQSTRNRHTLDLATKIGYDPISHRAFMTCSYRVIGESITVRM